MRNFIDAKIKKSLEVLKQEFYAEKTQIEVAYCQENAERIDLVDDSLWKEFSLPYRWERKQPFGAIKTTFTIPESMDKKPVEFFVKTGLEGKWDAVNPQFSLYVNGELWQGIDINHTSARICECAKAGQSYDILMLGYLGDKPGEALLRLSFAAVNEDVIKLYYDIKTPFDVTQMLPRDDETRIMLEHELNEAVNLIDFRYPQSGEFFASVQKSQSYMDGFYQNICGKEKSPEVYMIGHTHIDVAWLWPLRLTRLKSVCSFSTAERLMQRFEKYKFMSSQPQLYEFVKEQNPILFEKIKKQVKEGQWEAEGAMWLEADCNLTSGESLVRQILFGKRFFMREFGVDNRILWLPDVFGYSAALPQILKKCGVDYFVTSKISWNDTNKMPYDIFTWEGIDGSNVLTYFITTCDSPVKNDQFYTTYNGSASAQSIKGTWERFQQKRITDKTLTLVGFGDGGGGTTPEMIESALRLEKGIPGCPKLKFAKAIDFFNDMEKDVKDSKHLPKWVGELYLEYHRGTYSTMNKTKKYNRKSEILLEDAEFFSVLANRSDGAIYPQETLNSAWKTILLNQFHDILPGSSIKAVYDESYGQYKKITNETNTIIRTNLDAIANHIQLNAKSVVAFNNLSFVRDDICEAPEACCVLDGDEMLPTQKTHDGKCIFIAKNVPQKGYKAFSVNAYKSGKAISEIIEDSENSKVIETYFYNVNIDKNGNITRIYDKENSREVLKNGEKTMIEAYEDMPEMYENWDIAPYYAEKMWEISDADKVTILENGSVRTLIRVIKPYYNSKVQYDIILYKHTRRIDFKFAVDWKEKNILVKFKVPADILASQATYEIQYGNTKRNTHKNTSWDTAKYEVCAHKWADISESNYGVSMLNDCKYGHQIYEGDLRWTINKSTCEPNPEAGKDYQEFTLSILPHSGALSVDTIREAYFLNTEMRSLLLDAQKGDLPKECSLVSVNNEAVITEVIKKAEDEDGVIIRMYESTGGRQSVTVSTDLPYDTVYECNLLEKEPVFVEKGNVFTAQFKPFEIKTFLVRK